MVKPTEDSDRPPSRPSSRNQSRSNSGEHRNRWALSPLPLDQRQFPHSGSVHGGYPSSTQPQQPQQPQPPFYHPQHPHSQQSMSHFHPHHHNHSQQQQHHVHPHPQQQQHQPPSRSPPPPPPAPPKPKQFWRTTIDPKTKKPYYYHSRTKQVAWDKPLEMLREEQEKQAWMRATAHYRHMKEQTVAAEYHREGAAKQKQPQSSSASTSTVFRRHRSSGRSNNTSPNQGQTRAEQPQKEGERGSKKSSTNNEETLFKRPTNDDMQDSEQEEEEVMEIEIEKEEEKGKEANVPQPSNTDNNNKPATSVAWTSPNTNSVVPPQPHPTTASDAFEELFETNELLPQKTRAKPKLAPKKRGPKLDQKNNLDITAVVKTLTPLEAAQQELMEWTQRNDHRLQHLGVQQHLLAQKLQSKPYLSTPSNDNDNNTTDEDRVTRHHIVTQRSKILSELERLGQEREALQKTILLFQDRERQEAEDAKKNELLPTETTTVGTTAASQHGRVSASKVSMEGDDKPFLKSHDQPQGDNEVQKSVIPQDGPPEVVAKDDSELETQTSSLRQPPTATPKPRSKQPKEVAAKTLEAVGMEDSAATNASRSTSDTIAATLQEEFAKEATKAKPVEPAFVTTTSRASPNQPTTVREPEKPSIPFPGEESSQTKHNEQNLGAPKAKDSRLAEPTVLEKPKEAQSESLQGKATEAKDFSSPMKPTVQEEGPAQTEKTTANTSRGKTSRGKTRLKDKGNEQETAARDRTKTSTPPLPKSKKRRQKEADPNEAKSSPKRSRSVFPGDEDVPFKARLNGLRKIFVSVGGCRVKRYFNTAVRGGGMVVVGDEADMFGVLPSSLNGSDELEIVVYETTRAVVSSLQLYPSEWDHDESELERFSRDVVIPTLAEIGIVGKDRSIIPGIFGTLLLNREFLIRHAPSTHEEEAATLIDAAAVLALDKLQKGELSSRFFRLVDAFDGGSDNCAMLLLQAA